MLDIYKGLVRKWLAVLAAATSIGCFPGVVVAEEGTPTRVLFKNVNIFDGTSDKLTTGMDVLVTGNLIGMIGKGLSTDEGATVVDGGGRTLMPGLIEGHGHLMMNGTSLADIENNRNWEELASRAAAKADMALMSGFTSWRDMGGISDNREAIRLW